MLSRTASTIITGLLVMSPSGSAHARVTGITFEPKSPIVGQSVTAIATDDRKHEVAQWNWFCILADAGASNHRTITPIEPGRANLKLLCGGTYKVSLQVTYQGPKTPPSETISVSLVIARPDKFTIVEGIDTSTRYPGSASMITIRSQINSREKDAGKHLLGMAQQRVRNRTWWNKKQDPDQPWLPPAPGPHVNHSKGVIECWVTLDIDPEDWAKIRPGSPIVSWDEDLRVIYMLGYPRNKGEWPPHSTGKEVTIECPLGTKHLSIVKVDEDHWAVHEQRPKQPE